MKAKKTCARKRKNRVRWVKVDKNTPGQRVLWIPPGINPPAGYKTDRAGV